MKLIAYLIIVTSFNQWAYAQHAKMGTEFNCKHADRIIKKYSDTVKAKFKIRSVDHEVDVIEAIFQHCKLQISEYGWGSGIFKYWKDASNKLTLERHKLKIEKVALFRNLTDKEISDYISLGNQLNLDKNKIEEYILELRSDNEKRLSLEKKECTDVDLRTIDLGNVRDQDSIGWCFAFAAADLLSHKLGKRISAADGAMSYHNGLKPTEGGFASDTIDRLMAKGGACLEADINSEDNTFANIKSNISVINSFLNGNRKDCENALKSLFPNLPYQTFLEIVSKTAEDEVIEQLRLKSCLSRIKFDHDVKEEYSKARFLKEDIAEINPLFKTINEQLTKRNMVGISYDSSILVQEVVNIPATIRHASNLVARKFNEDKGECEYLIRNTWGRSCSGYSSELKCEEGNIWVPKSKLNTKIGRVVYLE